MRSPTFPSKQRHRIPILLAVALALLVVPLAVVNGQQGKPDVLRIGTSGSLTSAHSKRREQAALQTLRKFIKDETGLDNEIVREKDWQELADKMAKGQFQVGVLHGYEFAWAQEKQPELKPLAIAVNVYPYPVVYVITGRDNPAKDFAGLQGQSLSIPDTGERFLNLFVERQCQAVGKTMSTFFSKITYPNNVESALDDVVDGVTGATVVDRAALEAYKQRKPGRFDQLKPVAKSKPFPSAVVAYDDNKLDESTRNQLLKGLLDAANNDRGQMMLTMFRLTGFQRPPADYEKVLAETRKAYPPSSESK